MMDLGLSKMVSVGLTLRQRSLLPLGLKSSQEARQSLGRWLYFQQLKDNLPVLRQCFPFP